MRRFALLKPTELAQLAELSERHEDLMQYLATSQGGAGAPASPSASPGLVMNEREVQIELRQLRQETLKLLASLAQKIEKL